MTSDPDCLPALYVVATPVGNLADITQRALSILESVDYIAAEDTRHSKHLLAHYAIETPCFSLHAHNEAQKLASCLKKLADGSSIALISDAGTPLISDPGSLLVRAVKEAGYRVVPVPGCCAAITALSVSGLSTAQFRFVGFLPSKGRESALCELKEDTSTLVLYESPKRLIKLLEMVVLHFSPDRLVCLAREMTKTFETVVTKPAAELLTFVQADANQQRGECVVLIAGKEVVDKQMLSPEARRLLLALRADLPLKKAAQITAAHYGLSKKALYDFGLSELNKVEK